MKTVLISAFFAATLTTALQAQDASDAIFAEWDLDSSGQVSVLEARTTLTAIFSDFDTNLDGYLDDSDTSEADAAEAPDGDESAVALEFDDDGGDGKVSLLEFINQDDDWIALMDRDGDGFVTIDDFTTL
ncbi:MAG: Ca2+-binding EF-hand superfamily protein [Paracoccaceae bacterium]|jgi:Ca2+-binding EF-hand superfamily protein